MYAMKKEYLFLFLLIELCKCTMPNKFNRNKKIPVRNNDEEVEFSGDMTLVLVISTIILGFVGVSIYNHLLRAEIIHDQLYRQDRRG